MARVALVTGGTRGIGAAICKALKAAGYTVAANYGGNDEAAQKFKAEPGVNVYKWDVSSFDACAVGVKQVEADLGPIDVLVNNAGITRDSQLHRMKLEQWTAVINTNLYGSFLTTQQALPSMMKGRWGRVVNITSVVGLAGNPGQANYVASKAGLIGLTKSLAQEMAPRNITVNAVAPGFIETDMTAVLPEELKAKILQSIPLRRLGSANEVAAAVKFLCSEEAGYITGQVLSVNGGMYM